MNIPVDYLNKFKIEKYNDWFEAVKEVSLFMGEKQGKWLKRCKGMKPNRIRDLIKQARGGENPRALFNWLMKNG